VKKPRKPARKAKAGPKVWTGEPWGPSWGDQTQDEWEEEQRRGKVVFIGESENTRLLRMLVKQQKAQAAQQVPAKPKGGRKAKARAKGRPSVKSDLVLDILAGIDQSDEGLASNLPPAVIEQKVLPLFRPRWAKLRPDDDTDPPVSRKVINEAYKKYLGTRSSK
jgi:hypothetical protein